MISLTNAKNEFLAFARQFDLTNPKIEIKVRHTYGVMNICDYLSKSMHLSNEDYSLAMLIALLHDIGRFEQLTRFNSYDDTLLSHAACGIEYLFEQGAIRNYISSDNYDEIIYHAIKNHSSYSIDSALSGSSLFHAKLIRDADKLDNFRVRTEDSIEAIFNLSPEELGQTSISEKVFYSILSQKTVLKSDRKTPMDIWLTVPALIFDLNFPASFQYIYENDYINRILDRVPYSNPETMEKMTIIKEHLMNHVKMQSVFFPSVN